MCASCVAQGVTYVGGSVGILRVMAFRAARRRVRDVAGTPDGAVVSPPTPSAASTPR